MVNPYIAEVSAYAFDWAPQGWLPCEGQLVSVQQFNQLFALIGKTFGGDGISTFGVPKLVPLTEDGGKFCISPFGAAPAAGRHPLPGETTILAAQAGPAPWWLEARGGLIQIAQNQALFQILGTTFGGDGKTTFGLPDMWNVLPFTVGGNYGFASYYIGNAPFSTEQSYLGEVKVFPSAVQPTGWLPCDGRLMQVSSNTALFALLGGRYGGDGKTTFALPNLTQQRRMPAGLQFFISQLGVFPQRS